MNKRLLPRTQSCLIVLFIVAYLLKSFFYLAFLPYLMSGLAVAFLCISLPGIKTINRNLIILLLFFSGLLILSGPGSFDWAAAIITNDGIVVLLLTVPMLGAILSYAPYETAIMSLANRHIQSSNAFYLTALSLVAFLGSLMTLAALPFTYQLLKPIADRYPSYILYRALSRGFIVNLFWAPNVITIAVVLQYVNISWQQLALAGIVFSAITYTVAWVFGTFERYRPLSVSEQDKTAEPVNLFVTREHKRRFIALLLQVGLIVAFIISLSHYAPKNIFANVAPVALTMPLLIALVSRKLSVYKHRLEHYLHTILPGMSNEFMLFLSIGFLGYSLGRVLNITSLQNHTAFFGGIEPGLLCLFVIILIVGLAISGVHPIITISSRSIALGKIELGLSNIHLAITFITGYVLYLIISPFSSMVMILSGFSGRNVYQMGLGLNWRYALAITLVVAFIIQIWAKRETLLFFGMP